MRLWHKDLIHVLPRKQLLEQWRECCLIAKNIKEKGTPNHILVNRIMDYSLDDFYTYCYLIKDECIKRGYKCSSKAFEYLFNIRKENYFELKIIDMNIFKDWHNDRYYLQCYYNLQEKYDCGGITEDEWRIIESTFSTVIEDL